MCENLGEIAAPAATGFGLAQCFRRDRRYNGPDQHPDRPGKDRPSKAPTLQRVPEWGKALLAGGIASCCAKTAVAPLDRTKILLQAHNSHYKHLGIFSTLEAIWRREGVQGWYKGNWCQMVRIFPYGAVQFMAFEQFKKALTPRLDHPHLAKLLAGSLGGMAAVILTYPLDMVRVRLMFQVKGEHLYEGIWHTFRTIWAQEGGIMAFYRGFVPTLIGMVPYSGLSFFTFDTLKQLLLESGPAIFLQHGGEGDRALRAPVNLVLGGVAGAIAQTASYPLDVTRRRMQLAVITANADKFSGCVQTLLTVYRTDGVKHGLYRGISVNYLRVIPQVAMSFCVYEICKQLFRMEQNPPNSQPNSRLEQNPPNSQQNSRKEHTYNLQRNSNSQKTAENSTEKTQNSKLS
ncbi:PREDICTED: graves disease carrier protein homolog isoform X1 [Branchiostoma belcheri]|uniref:Graves disease carrier protein homolog isoform X1 n=1 Tax=Branchiostoma belcheri TaxID=7741 RepID=A0A6P4ZRT9_BRABE|nr:PREDICTED: graves disease carrier protein homolog isoform X1 [Branchiostoma belcheri]